MYRTIYEYGQSCLETKVTPLIIFDKQYTDNNFELMRQTLSIRNICYYVEIEKLTVIMRESIKTIDIY